MSDSSPRSPQKSDVSGVSGSDSADANIPKLNPITLGAHDSSHRKNNSTKQYVGSWVTAQKEFVIKDSVLSAKASSQDSQNTATPAILLTNVDEDDSTSTELVSAKDKVFVSKRGGRRHSLEPRLSPRKVSMLPTSLNQTILEEPEGGGESGNEEGEACDNFTETLEGEDLLAGINTRQRAKSYPSQAAPVPMLELPRENVPSQQSTGTAENTGLRNCELINESAKQIAQVAILAKKWKKRSADCENEVIENTLESVALRQKKRPFVEVPRSLKIEILEDAYPIVQKTYQLYKSYLGPRHKLTVLAEKHLENLSLQLEK